MKIDIPKKWLADRIEQFGDDEDFPCGVMAISPDLYAKWRKFIIMASISGMGKSTYAEKLAKETNAEIICPDVLREEVTGDAGDISQDNYIWNKLVPTRIETAIKNHNRNIIFDATQLNPKARKPIIDYVKQFSNDSIFIECHYLEPNLELALKQNKMRTRQVPEWVIENQFKKWIVPDYKEGFSIIKKIN